MQVNYKERVYDANINSLDDLEKLCNTEKVRDKIYKFRSRWPFLLCNVDEMQAQMSIGSLFKEAYWYSLGCSNDALTEMNKFHATLDKSIKVCDRLSMMFIRSLNFHQMASIFLFNNQEFVTRSMAETEDLATTLTDEFGKLGNEFISSKKRVDKIISDISNLVLLCYERANNTVIKKGLCNLMIAQNALLKIQTVLLNIGAFWNKLAFHTNKLRDSDLSKTEMLELMVLAQTEKFVLRKEDRDFIEMLMNIKRTITFNIENSITNLSDISIKTGRNVLQARTPMPFEGLIEPIEGTEEELEKSFVKWLDLAKINIEMTKCMRNALNNLNIYQFDIYQIEKDPLVKALQSSALIRKEGK